MLWLAGIAGFLLLVPNAIAAWGYRGVELLGNAEPDTSNAPVIGALILASAVGNLLVDPGRCRIACRRRRAVPAVEHVERQQIKWFAAAAARGSVAPRLHGIREPDRTRLTCSPPVVVIPLVPIAIGVAILRYRLYEIDRIVSRTIGWAIVTGLLVAVFAGLVVALQALLAPVTNENTLAVAASTLVAFALFQPLRRRVQRAVDRRFDRARYDGQRTVDAFAERLRGSRDLTTVDEALLATVASAMQPQSATVWLRATA